MRHERTTCSLGQLFILGLCAIPSCYFLFVTTISIRDLTNANGSPVGEDFAQIWLGGRLALEAKVHAIYTPELFRHLAQAAFGTDRIPWIFSYPPTTLLMAAPLGALPYAVALGIWSVAQVAIFAAAVLFVTRRFLSPDLAVILALTSPSLALTLPWGQFGAIIASLMAFSLLLLDRKPVLAGVLIGLIAVKPQFDLLIPIALLASRRWETFWVAAATVVALVLATLALFGTQAWTGYLNQTLPAQVAINADPTGYMPIAHSIVDRLVLMGADVSVARYLQLGIAGAACLATLIAFGRPYPPAHRFFVAAASTMAALPTLPSTIRPWSLWQHWHCWRPAEASAGHSRSFCFSFGRPQS